jgi:hypothetical protein
VIGLLILDVWLKESVKLSFLHAWKVKTEKQIAKKLKIAVYRNFAEIFDKYIVFFIICMF